MTLSSQTRNSSCVKLETRYRDIRKSLKKQIASRRVKPDLDLNEHMNTIFKLHRLPRNSSATRIKNRCAITGRGRGIYRYFGICGMKIREMALKGLLPGVKHASW